MRDRFIPALITLIAGAITCIIDIYRRADLLSSLKRLLFVIIIFYFIGLIAKAIIRKVLEPKPGTSDEETDNEAKAYTEKNNSEYNSDEKPEVNPKDKPEDKPEVIPKDIPEVIP